MVTSGGYQRSTARIIADSVLNLRSKNLISNDNPEEFKAFYAAVRGMGTAVCFYRFSCVASDPVVYCTSTVLHIRLHEKSDIDTGEVRYGYRILVCVHKTL